MTKESTKVSFWKTKDTVRGPSSGLMAASTQVAGSRASSTEWATSEMQISKNSEKVSGTWAKEPNGLKIEN